jgi:Gpi18-like mannosyltransferase
LRIYFIPFPGYEQEIQNYKIWSQSAVQFGTHNIYDRTWCDIPPVYPYVLNGIGHIYRLFSPKFEYNTYLFQFLIKFPPILADLLISLIIFFFLRKKKNSFSVAFLAMSAYAFNPAVIFSSACWGQMDSIALLFALGAVVALVDRKYFWAWSLIAVGVLTKVQLAVLLPIFVLITWRRKGLKTLLNGMTAFWCAFVFILLPFLRFHQVDRIIDRVFNAAGGYPYLSFCAFNLWWLFRGGPGKWVMDTSLFLNLFSYRTLGNVFLGMVFLLLLGYLFYRDKEEDSVFFGSFLAVFSFFMLATRVHERYAAFSLAFLLLAAVRRRNLRVVYSILSLTAFMNIFIALFWAYPKNFPAPPHLFQLMPADDLISLINISLFFFVLFIIGKATKLKYLGYLLAAVLMIFAGFSLTRTPHPVFLSDLAPKTQYQQSGQLRMDRSTGGNPLTVNGFIFSKGIGTNAYSSLEYDLGGRYRYLEGMVGLDDYASRGNKIEAWIYADNKLIYNSGIFGGWVNPHYFFLKISGTKILKLIISDGGDGIDNDHGDWLGIKVLP